MKIKGTKLNKNKAVVIVHVFSQMLQLKSVFCRVKVFFFHIIKIESKTGLQSWVDNDYFREFMFLKNV